jgi:nitroimidazol reductase NimA-like FMN-containing flavoprotein (pyridoxamine 5'-phosphate oxidase superfamily)
MPEPIAQRPHMPDYGVDEASWNPLPWSWAAARLAPGRNYWVVTASPEGQPHALPVWGVWDDGEHRFAFSCGPRSRKARDIAANPRIAVMVDDTVECVSLEGRAEALTDDARRQQWTQRYVEKYLPIEPGLTADFVLSNLIVEFTPSVAYSVIERAEEFETRATRWRFQA